MLIFPKKNDKNGINVHWWSGATCKTLQTACAGRCKNCRNKCLKWWSMAPLMIYQESSFGCALLNLRTP